MVLMTLLIRRVRLDVRVHLYVFSSMLMTLYQLVR